MRKSIIFRLIIIVFLSVILLVFNSNKTTTFSGLITQNGLESNVLVKIKHNNFYSIFDNMKGEIIIENENIQDKYNFSGTVYGNEKCNLINIIGFIGNGEDGRFDTGTLFFDDGLNNIVMMTDERTIYSADDNFIDIVKELRVATWETFSHLGTAD